MDRYRDGVESAATYSRPPRAATHERLVRRRRRSRVVGLASVLVILATACTGRPHALPVRRSLPAITGHVIGLAGLPIAGAIVEAEGSRTSTDAAGRFSITASRPGWVVASHEGFLTRARAGAPGEPMLFRLTPDDGHTLSLHFGGDVMFGRRFYDPNQDGDTSDGLLQPGDGAGPHLSMLAGVDPLLRSADLTVVNLETPLVSQPYIDPTRPRPPTYHQSKSYVFASAPVAAQALAQAGVDVVDLGNNHLYDALDKGVSSTIAALEAAGFHAGRGYFGAGRNEAEAWKPAIVKAKGTTIAFIGCTTVTRPYQRLGPTIAGHPHERIIPGGISYVAHGTSKGGAAACEERRIAQAVRAARQQADVVVFMVHGGVEYWPSPSPVVRRMSMAAASAGATLVIDGHPHVVGGLREAGRSLIAWSMGNLLFDQDVWPTFQSYLLDVDVRGAQVLRAYAEPLMLENYRPVGLTGDLADYVARTAAGMDRVAAAIEDGAAEIDVGRLAARGDTSRVFTSPPPGSIFGMPRGSWVRTFSGPGRLELGRDLLWTGSFEDGDVDQEHGEAPLWDFDAEGVESSDSAAYTGGGGARLFRQASDCQDAILTPTHRLLVEPGKGISVLGMARLSSSARASVQLSWYRDLKGPSASQTIRAIEPAAGGGWRRFRIDATVPPGTVAVGLYVRLSPTGRGASTADLDDLRVIEWAPQGAAPTPLYRFIRVTGTASVGITHPYLPGGSPGSDAPEVISGSASDLLVSPPPSVPVQPGCESGD